MIEGRHEQEEYLEQDADEQDAAGRRKSLIALAIMAVLVIAGIVLVGRLRELSAIQDCLMTRATNCGEPIPAGGGPSTMR